MPDELKLCGRNRDRIIVKAKEIYLQTKITKIDVNNTTTVSIGKSCAPASQPCIDSFASIKKKATA